MVQGRHGRPSTAGGRRFVVTIMGIGLPLVLIGAALLFLVSELDARGSKLTPSGELAKIVRPWAR